MDDPINEMVNPRDELGAPEPDSLKVEPNQERKVVRPVDLAQ